MQTWMFIVLAVLFLIAAFLYNVSVTYKSASTKRLADPECVQKIIDRTMKSLENISPLLTTPAYIEASLNRKAEYEEWRQSGISYLELTQRIFDDIVGIIRAQAEKLKQATSDPRSLFYEEPEEEKEYRWLMEERGRTPRAAIAALFQIPWSQLREKEYQHGFYITDTVGGHTWRVPVKEIATYITFDDGTTGRMAMGMSHTIYEIYEIDENRKPVVVHLFAESDIETALVNNGNYVTEIKKPKSRFFIGALF